jgi:formylglycine-generating enzyme required for sulfatase activity
MEFGWAVGWDLPSVMQWEKAFRGADTRRYPWWEEPDAGFTNTERVVTGPWPSGRIGISQDKSPYGVWSLAGNVSEWVRTPATLHGNQEDLDFFLKGGNWRHKRRYGLAGSFLGVRGAARGDNVGIRVVKEIFPGRTQPY